jgi:hypothetical protein
MVVEQSKGSVSQRLMTLYNKFAGLMRHLPDLCDTVLLQSTIYEVLKTTCTNMCGRARRCDMFVSGE